MRLVFTLVISFVLSVSVAQAQDFPLQFADAQGNIFADGTELTLDKPIIESYGYGDEVMMPSGVYVLNTTADEVNCGTSYSISKFSNGVFQTCFPMNCVQRNGTGSWTSEVGTVSGNELKNMQTEWLPDAEGAVDTEFQLLKYKMNPVTKKYTVEANGPKIKMHFVYDTSSVRSTELSTDRIASVSYYSLDGRKVETPAHGAYVMKVTYSNGVTKTTKQIF